MGAFYHLCNRNGLLPAILADEIFDKKPVCRNVACDFTLLEISSVKIFFSSYKVLPRGTLLPFGNLWNIGKSCPVYHGNLCLDRITAYDLVQAEMDVWCLLFSLHIDLKIINHRSRQNNFDLSSSFVHRGIRSYLHRLEKYTGRWQNIRCDEIYVFSSH